MCRAAVVSVCLGNGERSAVALHVCTYERIGGNQMRERGGKEGGRETPTNAVYMCMWCVYE